MGIPPTNPPVPNVPPPYTCPPFPQDEEEYLEESLHGTNTVPPKIPESECNKEHTIISKDHSSATEYDYHTFVSHGKVQKQHIPNHVPRSTLTTTLDNYLEDPDNPTPFIKS